MSEDFGVQYDADYFLRGKETGKSLYENYRWLPELTIPMASRMAQYLGMRPGDSVLDYGCARGYTVKAFRALGYDATGVDISHWAIDNCDPDVAPFLYKSAYFLSVDWVVAKDVLEHVPDANLPMVVEWILDKAKRGFMVIVPLAPARDHKYTIPEYELDVTHVQRLSLQDWLDLLSHGQHSKEFMFTFSYLLPGLKDNYKNHYHGNGFIMGHRI